MKVVKCINNNVAICLDDDNNELVAFGKGIGFKKPPFEIDVTVIQKTYYGIDENYVHMINEIPEEILLLSEEIIKYAENDQAYDYTFEGYDFGSKTNFGEKVKWSLSDLLEDNELVILNFWYTTCSWCVREFPYLIDTYSQYQDKVKVIGINPGERYNDTVDTVKTFASEHKLNIMSTVGDTTLIAPVGLKGYPTSVFIDRYGTITMIEDGAITTKDKWDGLFAKYTGDNYVPTYEASGSEVTPDVDFPRISSIRKSSFS